jgi:hypothetical protein
MPGIPRWKKHERGSFDQPSSTATSLPRSITLGGSQQPARSLPGRMIGSVRYGSETGMARVAFCCVCLWSARSR